MCLCNHVYEKHIEEAALRARACALMFALKEREAVRLRDRPPNLELIKAQLSARLTAPPPPSHEKCVLYNQEQRKRKLITHTSCVTCGIPLSIIRSKPEATVGPLQEELSKDVSLCPDCVFLCVFM